MSHNPSSIRLPSMPEFDTRSSKTERMLTAEVEDLNHIHELSLRLAGANSLVDVLLDVLQTAATLVNARLGTTQIVEPNGMLSMVGQFGFGSDVLEKFASVGLEDCSTCAVALKRRARTIVPDLHTDPDFSEIAAALFSYGAVGAVSTPVLDKAGNVLAMFSVYWLEAHEPDDRELRALDLCAELAGRHVERSFAAKALLEQNERNVLLMRELAHRGKNLLAIIQAIAGQSLRGNRSLDEAREAFVGRLGALAHTYNTLTDKSPESLQLHDIMAASLKFQSERTTIRGPDILVPAKNAQTLALMIHELATNATKYGALSNASGRVEIEWKIHRTGSDEQFLLTWSEIDGPPSKVPDDLGFGSVILTSVVGSELKCKPTLDYQENGFQYNLDCSLSALTNSSQTSR